MANMSYPKYVLFDEQAGQDLPFGFKTSTQARKSIISWYLNSPRFAKKLWVRNTQTGLLEGKVEIYNHYGTKQIYYVTWDSKERRIHADGTFVKKKPKTEYGISGKLRPFGL